MKVFSFGLSLCLFLGTVSVWSMPYEGDQSLHSIVVLKAAPTSMAVGAQGGNRSVQRRAPVPATTYRQQLLAKQASVFEQCLQADPQAELGAQFTYLINAFSVRMSAEAVSELRENPDVKYISRVKTYKPTLTQSGVLMRLPEAYEKFDFGDTAGEGVFIGIIDTGVDVTHPAFRGEGYEYPEGFPKGDADFTNGKIIAARVFPPSVGQQGDTTLYDRDGHGSNVASIAAANLDVKSPLGTIYGVAPRAYIGNYKIFTTDGASSTQIIAAIEAAVSDGADVLNMSFGFAAFDDPHHSAEIDAVRNAVAAGVTCVIAAQNEGRELTIGAPSQAEEAITVGAVTNSHRSNGSIDQYALRVSLWVNGEETIADEQANFGSPSNPSNSSGFFKEHIIGTFPLVDADNLDGGSYGGAEDGRACEDFPSGASAENWVLVQRGECQFIDKADRVQAIGGKGVLFYQSEEAATELIIPDSVGLTIPIVMVRRAFGLAVKEALANGDEVVIDVQGEPITDQPFTPNRMATYSSLGPSAEYSFKPDVSAVGAGSFGAIQNDQDYPGGTFIAGGFQWIEGTSQATPRVAGLAGLVQQVHPNWPPDWVKSAIVISAVNTAKSSNGSREAYEMETGAGRVDAVGATQVDTIVLPPKIGFGKMTLNETASAERYIRIINTTDQTCEYAITPLRFSNALSIELSEDSFTLEPGAKIEIKATASASEPDGEEDLEQRFQLSNITTGLNYSIPCWMRVIPAPEPKSVLLVDDDNGESSEDSYISWLNDIGRTYVHWDVDGEGDYPTADYMHKFDVVAWVQSGKSFNAIGDQTSDEFINAWNPQHLFESELQRYLGQGGALFHSGQDYFDQKEDAPLAAEAYGVRMAVHDQGATTIAGISGNPVGDGIASFTMSYTNGLENFVDMVRPLAGKGIAEVAFTSDGTSSRSVGLTIEGCNYRAVFLAFPLEAAESDAGKQVLENSLNWLDEATFSPSQVVSIEPNEIDLDSEDGPFFVTIQGEGFGYAEGYRAWFDSVPMEDMEHDDCSNVTGYLPADLQPGVYTLKIETGNGITLRLPDALTVKAEAKTPDWTLH